MGVIMQTGVGVIGAAGDRHVVLKSTSFIPGTKPLVVWCSPYESGSVNVNASGVGAWMVELDFPVVCCDLGQSRIGGVEGATPEWNGADGPEQWTHDTAMNALDSIWDARTGSLLQATDAPILLAGGSAGGAKVVQWSRLHPDRVAAAWTIIGAVDLLAVQQSRPDVITGIGATITAKLGNPVPDAKNPAKAYLDWTEDHPPLLMAYAAADPICIPSEAIALASAINTADGDAQAIERSTGGHESYYDVLDTTDRDWFLSHA